MTKGLNLGCGRLIFPTTRNNPFAQHIIYAIDLGCPQAMDETVEWVNVDRAALLGVDVVCNLFRYNWRIDNPIGRVKFPDAFADNTYDLIWCSHIIEHIPHQIKINDDSLVGMPYMYKLPDDTIRKLYNEDKDGWAAFFYECWRVLKPGGGLHIICPYGFSVAGISDPTHTRYITPGSFSYFAKNPDAPFDYEMPFEFKTAFKDDGITPITNMKVVAQASAVAEEAMKYDNMNDPEATEKFNELQQRLQEMTQFHIGYIDELYYCFEAVK